MIIKTHTRYWDWLVKEKYDWPVIWRMKVKCKCWFTAYRIVNTIIYWFSRSCRPCSKTWRKKSTERTWSNKKVCSKCWEYKEVFHKLRVKDWVQLYHSSCSECRTKDISQRASQLKFRKLKLLREQQWIYL